MQVLVTAASRHGATAEIAEAIGKRLDEHGIAASVVGPDEVTDLKGYDAVVLGSGVYAGHWLDGATKLVKRLGEQLQARQVWLFSSGPVGDPPRPEEAAVEVGDLMEATGANDHEIFAGKIDKELLGFPERAIVRALRVPEGDFRDWDAVARWSDRIATSLGAAAT